MSVIGVPIKVLHEAEGHIVTVETTTGEVRSMIVRPSKERLKKLTRLLTNSFHNIIHISKSLARMSVKLRVLYQL